MSRPGVGNTYDVIIAGAGPAGALAARRLARDGRRVALLDKARFPRPKPCGDCVSPRAWEIWKRHGLTDGFAALPHRVLREVEIQAEGATVYRGAVPKQADEFRAVDRGALDAWLAGEAVQSGADFFQETAVRAVHPDGTVETDGADGPHSFRAEIVMGADGRNSLVAQQANLLRTRKNRCRRAGWQLSLSGLPDSETVVMNVFREGYYGLTDLGNGAANLALVLDGQGGVRPDDIVARYLPGARVLAQRSIAPISRPPAIPAQGRVWLLGDAVRVLEPFTGEGIYFALASADKASELASLHWNVWTRGEMTALYKEWSGVLYRGELGINDLARFLLGSQAARLRIVPRLRHMPFLVAWMEKRVLCPPEKLRERFWFF
jgi:flavin-dependent dehydrogenase